LKEKCLTVRCWQCNRVSQLIYFILGKLEEMGDERKMKARQKLEMGESSKVRQKLIILRKQSVRTAKVTPIDAQLSLISCMMGKGLLLRGDG